MEQLDVGADDGGVGEAGRHDAADEVGEGRDAVHEDPEAGQLGRAGEHAAEDQAQREHQVGEVAGRLGAVHARDDQVRERRREHQELPDEEEHQAAALRHRARGYGVVVQANGVVPAEEDEDAHQGVPREFDDDVGDDEDLPGVRLGGPLTHFVQRSLRDEVGHDLLDQVSKD